MIELLQNALYITEDDLYLVSLHTHDFRGHKLRDGKEIFVDGGCEYARRVGDLYALNDANRYVECCLTVETPFEQVADQLLWGSAGKGGKGPMVFRPIKEWAYKEDGEEHLKAILKNVPNIRPMHKRVVEHWLAVREREVGQP